MKKYILARGKGLVKAKSVLPDADTPFPNYAGQYFILADGSEVDNEDCYILPSNPVERQGRLEVLAADAETRRGQLGDLADDPAVLAVLAEAR